MLLGWPCSRSATPCWRTTSAVRGAMGALAYNLCTWCWSLALIGLFLRYLSSDNPALRYLAQGSYWVYLIHFPLTIGFGALLYEAALPALVKMGINIGATTLLALLSYHLLVRSTALGTVLTGQRHPLKKSHSEIDEEPIV
jgi:glucan biosynthesis protein C